MDNNTDNTSAQELYGEGAVLGNEDDATGITVMDNSGSSQQINLSDVDEDDKSPLDDPSEEAVTEESTNNTEEPSQEATIESQVTKSEETMKAISDNLSEKGIDFNKVIEEFDSKGILSNDTRKALNDAGYPDVVINGFIESRQVLADRYTEKVYALAGGEDNFRAITEWAGANLGNDEVNAFNNAIDRGDLTVVKMLIENISSKRATRYGTRNPSIVGNTAGATANLTGYANRDELVKAMSDRRYETDSKYRHEVERKVLLTNFL